MQKKIITFCLVGSAVLIADSANLFESFVMFLLFGMIPGTDAPLPANVMLQIWCGLAALVTAPYLLLLAKRIQQIAIRSRRLA